MVKIYVRVWWTCHFRENHWMVMKKAQEKVSVKKYTDSPQDWTPFDAYLRINYHRLEIRMNGIE